MTRRRAFDPLNARIESVNACGIDSRSNHLQAMTPKPTSEQRGLAMLDWEDVRFFAALARHRTLLATARALKVTCESVERRLTSLESVLGYPLFQRSGGEFTLNAAGAAALAEAAQMEMAACSLLQKVP
jgi:molybdenum-dependent DNA-binding transcriptional regulator ModE